MQKYAGLTFAQACERIFRETSGSVVLIAVEITISGNDVPDSQEVSMSRVLLNPGKSLVMSEWIQCYVIADDLDQVYDHHICADTASAMGSSRGSAEPILNPMVDTFVEPQTPARKEDGGEDDMRTLTAYAALSTPNCPANPHDRSQEVTKRRALVRALVHLFTCGVLETKWVAAFRLSTRPPGFTRSCWYGIELVLTYKGKGTADTGMIHD